MARASEQRILGAVATPSEVFARIRDFLAGRHLGATRDWELLDEVLSCLFARIYLARCGHEDAGRKSTRPRYEAALRDARRRLDEPSLSTSISLDDATLEYVDEELAALDLASEELDLIADAYQAFAGSDSRGQQGQFFTPPPAIRTLVALVEPRPGERIIDPACGAGGFLFAVYNSLRAQDRSDRRVTDTVFGIDKDAYLVRIARLRLSLVTLRPANAIVGDSLAWKGPTAASFMADHPNGSFDVVLTNPPFGTKIVAASEQVRKTFSLAHRWRAASPVGRIEVTNELTPVSPPQVLFVERCVSLVRPGGRIGIVVPESLISSRQYRHVVEYLFRNTLVEAVIGMPEALFKTSGRGGTHTKTALVVLRKKGGGRRQPRIFMAEAAWCGHDSRARRIPKDDTPVITRNYRQWKLDGIRLAPSALGYEISPESIREGVLAPRAYDCGLSAALQVLQETHLLVPFGNLVAEGSIALSTGDEVGKLAYGTGQIPFVRTSDLSNWEIKLDPKHGVGRDLYESLRKKQDVQAGDILMVRDGTYLIGTCAFVTKFDTEMVFQSHIYKFRVNENDLIDSYLLLAILSSSIVQRQIRALSQTQDIINSLGSRIGSVLLPIFRDAGRRREISQNVQGIIRERAEARQLARRTIAEIDGQCGGTDHER